MSALHSRQTTLQGIHTIVGFEFADAAARLAGLPASPSNYLLVPSDVGRVGKQLDTSTYWILNGFSPLVWTQIGGIFDNAPDDMLVFGARGIGTSTTPRFLPFGFLPTQAPVSTVSIRASRSGTLRNLRVRHNAPGVGGSVTYAVRRNGVTTALSCSLTAADTIGSDLVNNIPVAAEDLLEIFVTKDAGLGASPSDVTATLEFNA